MPVLVAVIGAAIAVLVVVMAASGLAWLTVDDEPGERSGDESAERWLVDHLARVRGIRHVIGGLDRRMWGGAMVAFGLLAVVGGAALVGWLLSTVDSQRGFARFDESAAEWGASNATDTSTTALRWITHLGGTAGEGQRRGGPATGSVSGARNTRSVWFDPGSLIPNKAGEGAAGGHNVRPCQGCKPGPT